MVTSSGRCHGPGCTRTAVVERGFCGEACQERWHGQFDSLTTWRVGVRLAPGHDSPTVRWGEVAARSMVSMQASIASAAAALAGLGAVAAEVREQDDRLRSTFWPEERAEAAITAARDLARASTLTYRQAVDRVLDVYARAQGVGEIHAALADPHDDGGSNPGWLDRAFRRLGRTT